MKPEILQIAPMLPGVEAALGEAYRVHRYWEAPDRAALLAEAGPRIRGGGDRRPLRRSPPEVLAALPALEIVASYGVGYDAIDTAACKARGVRVTNTPDVLNDAVAELALGLMLALCRRIPQADAYVRAGRWPAGGFGLTGELTGAHAGILGLGRIGKEIARRLQAMKMRVSYHGRHAQPYEPYEYYPDLVAMARDVDWLVVIAPGLGRDPRHRLARGARGARAARARWSTSPAASLVDEAALVELLVAGGSAARRSTSSPTSRGCRRRCSRCRTSCSRRTRARRPRKTRAAMGDLVVRNLAAHFAGDPLLAGGLSARHLRSRIT